MKRSPELVFFTDRDLGRIVPNALRQAGVTVEAHDDHFDPLTPDTDWLKEVGSRDWIALSHNKDIRYNPEERDMVMRAGVPLFMLIGKRGHHILAQNLVQTLPKLLGFVRDNSPPYIAKIYTPPEKDFAAGKPGRIILWLTYDEWLAHHGP